MTVKPMKTIDELKPEIEAILRTSHKGHEKRAERWELAEKLFGESIPAAKRTNNNALERRMRAAISALRKGGSLICSDTNGGYWWAASIDDVLAMSGDLRHRARDLLVTARQLRAEALREFGGQQRMF